VAIPVQRFSQIWLSPLYESFKTSNIRIYFGYPLEREREKPTTLDFAQQLGVQWFFVQFVLLVVALGFRAPLAFLSPEGLGCHRFANVHWTAHHPTFM
jgi:hypothetical protein